MSENAFERRRVAFEEQFFKKQSQTLLEKLRHALSAQHDRESLKELTGIEDEKMIDTLLEIHSSGDTLAAFGLYPLVEVAWADGSVDSNERDAFLAVAAELGLAPGNPAHAALEEFVKHRPRDDARRAWYAWAAEVSKKLDADERKRLREGLLKRARAVAEASGGLAGFGSRVSPNEQRILDAIEAAFPD